jgi:hypothetical protein
MPSTSNELISLTTRHALRHCALPGIQGIYALHKREEAIKQVSKQLQDAGVPERQASKAIICACNMQGDDTSWWVTTPPIKATEILHNRSRGLLEMQQQPGRNSL